MAGVYPPPDQILSAMGIEVAWNDSENLVARSLVDIDLLSREPGPPGVGSLVPIIDLVGGSCAARTVGGDWLATADVWLFERSPIERGPIELEARLLRAGKRSTVVAVEVLAGSKPVVSSTIEFSRIRGDATSHKTRSAQRYGQWVRLGSGPLLEERLERACGYRVVDAGAGVVELDRAPFVNNSIGTLQGGAVALLADVSAAALIGPGSRTIDLHFRFLDQTGDGPARATAEVLRTDTDGHIVTVEVVDSSTDRLVGWANCRVQKPR